MLQVLINGMVLGSVYALIALGLTMVFSIMRVVNFAHGQMYMVGAFIVSFVRMAAISWFPELELAVLYVMAAAVLLMRPTGLFGRRL